MSPRQYIAKNGQDLSDPEYIASCRADTEARAEVFYALAECYALGKGTEKDPKLALYYYNSTSYHKANWSQLFTAYLYRDWAQSLHDAGKSKDEVAHYKRCAINDINNAIKDGELTGDELADAFYEKGLLHLSLRPLLSSYHFTSDDERNTFFSFQNANRLGHQGAKIQLGLCYQNGIGTEKNLKEAYKLFDEAAKKDEPLAQFELGRMYVDGIETEKDLKKAFSLFTEAANQNEPLAQFELGSCYQNGAGTTEDLKKALEFYEKALENDTKNEHNLNHYLVGCAYRDYAKTCIEEYLTKIESAIEHFNKATDTESLYQCGLLYEAHGNRKGALPQHIITAAEDRNPDALGVIESFKKMWHKREDYDSLAFHMFRKAARWGHKEASLKLAYAY